MKVHTETHEGMQQTGEDSGGVDESINRASLWDTSQCKVLMFRVWV